MKAIVTALLLLVLSVSQLKAQQDTTRTKKIRIIPLPALFYTPETRLGFGALVSGVFNLGDFSNTRSSNAQVLGAYTLNKQVIIQTRHSIFTPQEKLALNGELSYYDFPILYYGIGNDTKKEFEENLDYKVLIFRQRILKKVRPNWFAGLQYRYTHLYDLMYEPQVLDDQARLKSETGTNSGLGFSVIHDSRDNILNATQGIFTEISTFHHGSTIGSDFNFSRYTIDLRKYWPLNNSDVLATQYFAQMNTGNVPFREMALLGGETIMRGYYNGRFRDKQLMAWQIEYRKQIISWIGVVAFGALGDVAAELSDFQLNTLKYTIGGGLRVMVNKSERLNIRIDYGIGKETSGFYFAFAEAF
ncbi:MAG: BamA/TamA family outer membrane protein [Fulvivirga sp.]|nr:BamA/TamA family outer membrane protein [Fulvivirga sp.]